MKKVKRHLQKLLPGTLINYLYKERQKIEYYRSLQTLEDSLIKEYSDNECDDSASAPIFILASPRTGSTFFYQVLCKYLEVQYFSNVAESIAETPLVSWILSKSLIDQEKSKIACENEYGKSKGLAGPSEASRILSNWFNYKHPSETLSSDFITALTRRNMQKTFSIIEKFSGAPLVIKNAWNCFRVKAIQSAFPNAKFIHLKRNIINSSYSALLARKKQGNPQQIWNSASPKEFFELKKLPYYEQVVEQQYLINLAVTKSLYGSNSTIDINYEDFISTPIESIEMLAHFCSVKISKSLSELPKEIKPQSRIHRNTDMDIKKIKDYCIQRGYF